MQCTQPEVTTSMVSFCRQSSTNRTRLQSPIENKWEIICLWIFRFMSLVDDELWCKTGHFIVEAMRSSTAVPSECFYFLCFCYLIRICTLSQIALANEYKGRWIGVQRLSLFPYWLNQSIHFAACANETNVRSTNMCISKIWRLLQRNTILRYNYMLCASVV